MMDLDVKSLYGNNTKISEPAQLVRNEQNDCVIHQIELFPGALLIFHNIHVEHLDFSGASFDFPENIISIQHCREGRFEGAYKNGECFYLGPGDLSINLPVCQPDSNSFPLAYYLGLNLIIEPDAARNYIQKLEKLTGSLSIDFQKLFTLLTNGNHLIVYRENILDHILSELYSMQTDTDKGQMKLKVLEFLYRLCSLDFSKPAQPQYFNRSQVRIIKSIHSYLRNHPERHYTLEELSEHFDIPLTSMKTCFKGVYGMSIGAYIRDYRLELAAKLLKENSASIGDIAFFIGYESPSKFTEAFRKKFYCSPSEYRKDFKTN